MVNAMNLKKYTNEIESAKTLDQLCNALNEFQEYIDELNRDGVEFYRASDYVEMCDLQTFSENEPNNVCEIFSWDDTRVLTQNMCAGDKWEIVERTEDFG